MLALRGQRIHAAWRLCWCVWTPRHYRRNDRQLHQGCTDQAQLVVVWSTRSDVWWCSKHERIGLSSVLCPCQHSIGYMGDGFYRSTTFTKKYSNGCQVKCMSSLLYMSSCELLSVVHRCRRRGEFREELAAAAERHKYTVNVWRTSTISLCELATWPTVRRHK